MPSCGGRVRSLVLVMMLETLWPPGRQKNNGMGYFYGGAKQWATSRWDAGASVWCRAAGASRGLVGGKGGRTLNLPHCQLSALPISSVRQPDAPLSASVPPHQPLPLPQRGRTGWVDEWVGGELKHLPLRE